MRSNITFGMAVVLSAVLAAACSREEDATRVAADDTAAPTAQSGNAALPQSGNAVMPQTGNAAGAQAGNAVIPNSGNAAIPQDRNAATPQTGKPAADPAQAGDVRRISIEDARAEVERGNAVIFDVRGKEQFDAGHIAGAKLVPVGEVDDRLAEFPKDKLIVTYCA